MFKTAALFVARLTEVEKSALRGASNPDRLNWLFDTKHANEVTRTAFDEAVVELNETYRINSQSDQFGRTWAF